MAGWYLWDGREQQGPMELAELEGRIASSPDRDSLKVWREGLDGWQDLAEALGPQPTAAPPPLLPTLPAIEAPETAGNFITRHWRGLYPLWAAYWVVGLLSNVIAIFAILLASQFMVTAIPFQPVAIWTFFVTLWCALVSLAIWQTVGIWRSASRRTLMRRAMGRRSAWSVVAKIAVCLGWVQLAAVVVKSAVPQIAEATRMAFLGDPDIPSYALRVMNNGTEADINGGIKYGLARDFEALLKASPGVRTVHLGSVGGRIGEGKKPFALIRAHGLDTYVETRCMSACTLAFAAGKERILRHGASLGFHRAAFPGSQSDETSGVERQIYLASGISAAFVDRALATNHAEIWKPTETELTEAKVVTRISTGGEFAIGGDRLTREDWDTSLQKSAPVYPALKQARPADYNELVDIFTRGSSDGLPRAVLVAEAQVKLHAVIRALLPLADDTVLIEVGKLRADEYRALQGQDLAACYKYVSGVTVEPAIVKLIPPELSLRERALQAKIVQPAQKRDAQGSTQPIWDKIKVNLAKSGYTSADLDLFGHKTVAPSSYARYCAAAIAIYGEVVRLPPAEAGQMLREMFTDG